MWRHRRANHGAIVKIGPDAGAPCVSDLDLWEHWDLK